MPRGLEFSLASLLPADSSVIRIEGQGIMCDVPFAVQFGVPLYGGALTGEIVFMENNKLGCDVFQKPLVPVTLPVFLLVDRGDCYFVEKVQYFPLLPPEPWLLPAFPLPIFA